MDKTVAISFVAAAAAAAIWNWVSCECQNTIPENGGWKMKGRKEDGAYPMGPWECGVCASDEYDLVSHCTH